MQSTQFWNILRNIKIKNGNNRIFAFWHFNCDYNFKYYHNFFYWQLLHYKWILMMSFKTLNHDIQLNYEWYLQGQLFLVMFSLCKKKDVVTMIANETKLTSQFRYLVAGIFQLLIIMSNNTWQIRKTNIYSLIWNSFFILFGDIS